jgi:hypothetical protein
MKPRGVETNRRAHQFLVLLALCVWSWVVVVFIAMLGFAIVHWLRS